MSKSKKENKPRKVIDKERIRPFALLANVLNDDFKIFCGRLLFLIRENGISRTQPNLENKEEFLEFVKYVHQGWKEAQSIIIDRVLKNLDQIEKLQRKLKEAQQAKNREAVQKITYELNRQKVENTVMRRMVDSIAWSMLKNKPSTIRRLSIKGGHTNFSASNIKDAISTLDLYNKNDYQIALCCDLTTFIHVGDILVFDCQKGLTAFVELKSGNKNLALADLATMAIEAKCDAFEKELNEKLPDKDRRHFERLKKQAQVGKAVSDTLNNERGIDHNTGGNVRIFPTSYGPQSYGSNIVSCYEQLNEQKTWAIDSIDECLHIGVYNRVDQAFVAFNGWMDLIKCTSPIYNITDSFRIPTSTPFAALNLPTRLLEKIIKGEIIILLCLDIRAFMDMANSMFPNFFTYADRKRTAQADRGYMLPLKLEGKAILANDGIVGQGLADRILFDLQSPKQVIKMFKQMMDSE
ncbi:MAG: hypothetical protein LRY36_00275 [Alphaproteobacteria bacterium]|nr:hypothetical protein [Alphaproteobacteria bacterium]